MKKLITAGNTCQMLNKRDAPDKLMVIKTVILMIKKANWKKKNKQTKWTDKIIIIIINWCMYVVDVFVSSV